MAATQEFIRYRDLAPRPWEGFEGDPSWNPARDKWLENESVRIGQEDVNAFNRLKAAEAALDAARKAAARR